MNLMRLKSYGEWKPTLVPTARDYVQDGAYSILDAIENLGVELHGDFTSNFWYDHAVGTSADVFGWQTASVGTDNVTSTVTNNASFGRYRQDVENGTDIVTDGNGLTLELCGCPLANVTSGTWNHVMSSVQSPFGGGYVIEVVNLRGAENRVGATAGNVTGTNYNYSYVNTNGIKESDVVGGIIQRRHTYSATYSIGGDVVFYIDGIERMRFGNPYDMNRVVSNKLYSYIAISNVEFCCQRIYTRPLSATEIAANYAVDKARFNLGGES